MKQFLYLDTDSINSIIAQSEKGLVESISNEAGKENKTELTKSFEVKDSADIGGSILKIVKAENTLTFQGDRINSDSNSSTAREIISKTLHDASFDIAYDYINPNKINHKDHSHDDYGEYVDICRVFDFVDLGYLESLFSKGAFLNLLKKDPSSKSTNWNEMQNYLTAYKQIVPYSRMLVSNDGYLIPMEDKFFRVDPQSIGFKYGGDITCVGIITNIIGKDCEPIDNKNAFASFQFLINSTLCDLLPSDEDNLCVIHPIAIYYNG